MQRDRRRRAVSLVRAILAYPDSRLKTASLAVEDFDAEVAALEAALVDTLRSFPGCVGLAAPQIGVGRRGIAVDVTGHPKARSCHGLVVLWNPEIVASEGSEIAREGCLSIPDLTANVRRATQVVVRGLAANGSVEVIQADAFEARALLHEMDHLDGLLFLDRVASLKTDVFRRKRKDPGMESGK